MVVVMMRMMIEAAMEMKIHEVYYWLGLAISTACFEPQTEKPLLCACSGLL
jgi:hypothetical protein